MGNLTATEKQIAGAAAVVVILSVYALFALWGGLMFVTLLAGLAGLVILFLPADCAEHEGARLEGQPADGRRACWRRCSGCWPSFAG